MTAISWKTGTSGLWSTAADWSTGTVPGASDNVTISVAPSTAGVPYIIQFETSQTVNAVTLDQTYAELQIYYSQMSVGTTFALTAGALDLEGGTLEGGTLASSGGSLMVSGDGTLASLAADGTVKIVEDPTYGYADFYLDGVSFAGSGGTGTGSLSLGTDVSTYLEQAGLADVKISLANGDVIGDYSSSVSLAATTSVTMVAGTATGSNSDMFAEGGALTNQGTITDAVADYLQLEGVGVVNSGTISVSNGGTVVLDTYSGSITNTGLISVGSGGYLAIDLAAGESYSGTGSVSVTGGTLALDFALTTAQLASYPVSSGTLALLGTLTNASGTLAAGTGTKFANILLDGGDILGGTIISTANFTTVAGTLTGLTTEGTLSLTTSDASLTITKGMAMTGASGSGAGTIAVTGLDSTLTLLGSQALGGTVIDLGATPGADSYGDGVIDFSDPTSATSKVTLTASSSITQTGTYAEISGNTTYTSTGYAATGDTLVSNGSIAETLAGGSLTITGVDLLNNGHISVENGSVLNFGVGTVTNAGTILISGSTTNTYGTILPAEITFNSEYSDSAEGFANSGLVTIDAGGQLVLDGGSYNTGYTGLTWSNTGHINVTGGALDFGGTFTTSQIGSVTVSSGGSVTIDGDATLENSGKTFTVGGTSALGTVILDGIIAGGDIVDDGNGLDFGGGESETTAGTLNDVQYRGVLSIGGTDETATITGGISLTSTTGTGSGSISLTGAGAILYFASTERLAGSNISIGAASDSATLTGSNLTLANDSIVQTGASATLGYTSEDDSPSSTLTITTVKVTAAQSGGLLFLEGDIVNSGTIAVSNGETLVLDATAITNTGVISVTNGLLAVESATVAQLSEVTLSNSPVAVVGTLTATGTTLTVGAGTSFPEIELAGTILGGTIHDNGGGVSYYGYSVLDGVTYQGTLAISRPLATLLIEGGLTATDSTGKLAGSIAITGAGSQMVWDSTQSLNDVTISIGNPGITYEGDDLSAPGVVGSEYDYAYDYPVVLGSLVTVNQTGTYADLGGDSYEGGSIDTSSGTFSNAGVIKAAFSNGDLTLEGEAFTSTGTIAVSNTDTVTIGAASFTNAGLISIGTGSAMTLNLFNYFLDDVFTPESFTNAGSISLAGGSIVELTDSGTFPSVPLLNNTGAHISGYGTINSAIDNAGTLTASSGTLTIDQPVTGSGALVVDAGATLLLSAVSAGETASFSGVGGILALSPTSFLGEIGGFASGDTIDLQSTTATAASFSGSSLVVTLSTGTKLTLATTSALTGTLTATAGTHGDTLIKFASGSAKPTSPLVPVDPQPLSTSPAEAQMVSNATAFMPLHTGADVSIGLHMGH